MSTWRASWRAGKRRPRRPPLRVSGRQHAVQMELAARRVRVRHGNRMRAPMPECADADTAATHGVALPGGSFGGRQHAWLLVVPLACAGQVPLALLAVQFDARAQNAPAQVQVAAAPGLGQVQPRAQ